MLPYCNECMEVICPEAQDIPQAAIDYLADPGSFKDYSWQNEIYTSAPMQNHDLSVSGGGKAGTYRISAGYVNQDGITLENRI